jgi:hypothetical protein
VLNIFMYPENLGDLYPTLWFYADVDMTAGASGVTITLWDRTQEWALITLTSTSTSTTELFGALTQGEGEGTYQNGDFIEVQMTMVGGTEGVDQVFCENARLVLQYTSEGG